MEKTREDIRAYYRNWYMNHKDQAKVASEKSKQKIRLEALRAYGGENPICVCCGEVELKFLCFDHINNNGAEHRRTIGRSTSIYHWLRKNKYPPGFQILCYNCNNAKQYHQICPHQNGRNSTVNA